ncbi:hypothetical protein [Streptomyces sp. NPDC006739]|uniref:hypothetical protein n=1 Tax=Streptomyces sp. NPDC006739 TaxID=3364763 RepID=UPI003684B68D
MRKSEISLACASVGAAALLLPALSGCSADADGSEAAKQSVAATGAPVDPKHLTLPLDDYRILNKDILVIDRARVVLLKSCMRRFGVDLPVRAEDKVPGPQYDNERRYGLADAAEAARSGYHLFEKPVTPDTYSRKEKQLLDGTVTVSNGVSVPKGGCAGEAARKLSTEDAQEFNLVQKLNMSSYVASKKDPAVQEASRRWSSCMKNSGYSYPDPMAAINDSKFSGPTLGPDEKSVAKADVRCKQKVGFVAVWSTVETGYQHALIDHDKSKLAVLKARKAEIVKRADAVVRGGTA